MTAGRPRRPQNPPGTAKRRGRPPGSVSLTREIQQTIASLVRGGAFVTTAARAAGISERTFHDWMARGRGDHPTRSSTPKLKRFAREVDRAQAEARAGAEVRAYREHVKHWLRYAARSRPGNDGWSELKEWNQPAPGRGDTLEDRIREVEQRKAVAERDRHRAACRAKNCPSPWHERRFDNDENCTHPIERSRSRD
jgi:hypothetical protein